MQHRFKLPRPSATMYGIVAGLLAVGVQVIFKVQPPPAYGICMACHSRDVINWIVNHLFNAQWEVAPVSLVFPLLTTLGVFFGAAIAARRNREYRAFGLGHNIRSLIFGAIVMNAAILALGCPTRLLLLGAYGDIQGLVAIAGLIGGIVLGTLLLQKGVVD